MEKWYRRAGYVVLDKYETFLRLRADARAKVLGREKAASNVDNSGEGLLFATGFDKSGTTWLKQMLDSHPQVVCRGPGKFFNYFEPDRHFLGREGWYPAAVEALDEVTRTQQEDIYWIDRPQLESWIRSLIVRSMEAHRISPDIRVVGDKSVVQDCRLIREALPKAHIVAIVRDGRDVSISFAHQFQRFGRHGKFQSSEAETLDRTYLCKVAAAWGQYNAHVDNFRHDQDRFTLVKYEALLEDATGVMKDVFRSVGLDDSMSVVRQVVEANRFERLSGGRQPGEADNSSFYRKGIAGDWRNYFRASDGALYEKTAGSVLRSFGYEESPTWHETLPEERH